METAIGNKNEFIQGHNKKFHKY